MWNVEKLPGPPSPPLTRGIGCLVRGGAARRPPPLRFDCCPSIYILVLSTRHTCTAATTTTTTTTTYYYYSHNPLPLLFPSRHMSPLATTAPANLARVPSLCAAVYVHLCTGLQERSHKA